MYILTPLVVSRRHLQGHHGQPRHLLRQDGLYQGASQQFCGPQDDAKVHGCQVQYDAIDRPPLGPKADSAPSRQSVHGFGLPIGVPETSTVGRSDPSPRTHAYRVACSSDRVRLLGDWVRPRGDPNHDAASGCHLVQEGRRKLLHDQGSQAPALCLQVSLACRVAVERAETDIARSQYAHQRCTAWSPVLFQRR